MRDRRSPDTQSRRRGFLEANRYNKANSERDEAEIHDVLDAEVLRHVASDGWSEAAAKHFANPTTKPDAVDISFAGTDSALSVPTVRLTMLDFKRFAARSASRTNVWTSSEY